MKSAKDLIDEKLNEDVLDEDVKGILDLLGKANQMFTTYWKKQDGKAQKRLLTLGSALNDVVKRFQKLK